MPAEAAIVTRSFTVGNRIATLSVPRPRPGNRATACLLEWAPTPPQRLTAQEWAEYRAGRNAALAELARELGGNVAVLEV